MLLNLRIGAVMKWAVAQGFLESRAFALYSMDSSRVDPNLVGQQGAWPIARFDRGLMAFAKLWVRRWARARRVNHYVNSASPALPP